MTDQDSPNDELPQKQPEGVGMPDLQTIDSMVRPYFEGHWKNTLERTRLEADFRLEVLKTEFRFRKWMTIGIFVTVFIIIGLAFYLFATDRSDQAMQIIVGVVLVVMTFIAGYGVNKSSQTRTPDDE